MNSMNCQPSLLFPVSNVYDVLGGDGNWGQLDSRRVIIATIIGLSRQLFFMVIVLLPGITLILRGKKRQNIRWWSNDRGFVYHFSIHWCLGTNFKERVSRYMGKLSGITLSSSKKCTIEENVSSFALNRSFLAKTAIEPVILIQNWPLCGYFVQRLLLFGYFVKIWP